MRPVTRGRTLATVAFAALIVAACSSGAASPSAGAASPAATPATSAASSDASPAAAGDLAPLTDAVTVRFGVFPNITHAPGLVALADDGPLKKLLPNARHPGHAVQLGHAGQRGDPVRRPRHHLHRAQPRDQHVREDQRRGGPRDLGLDLGRRVPRRQAGHHQRGRPQGQEDRDPGRSGNTQDVALRSWLKEQGLSTDTAGGGDVSVVPQDNAQTLETFQAGTIDGAWVPEPWATRLIQDGGAKVLVDERDLWPDGKYVTTHLVVATKFLDANPEVVKRILLANLQAIDEVNADPAAAQATVNDRDREAHLQEARHGPPRRRLEEPHVHRRPDRVLAPEVGHRRARRSACSRTRATSRSSTT